MITWAQATSNLQVQYTTKEMGISCNQFVPKNTGAGNYKGTGVLVNNMASSEYALVL